MCISWKLKCWILLMHGVTTKFIASCCFLYIPVSDNLYTFMGSFQTLVNLSACKTSRFKASSLLTWHHILKNSWYCSMIFSTWLGCIYIIFCYCILVFRHLLKLSQWEGLKMLIVTMNLHLLLMKHHNLQHPQLNRVVLHQQMKEGRLL